MKIFKYYSEEYIYGYGAENEDLAREQLIEDFGEMNIDRFEEIPESEWDKKFILTYEDNDLEKEPFELSINDILLGKEPQLIFTNDQSLL